MYPYVSLEQAGLAEAFVTRITAVGCGLGLGRPQPGGVGRQVILQVAAPLKSLVAELEINQVAIISKLMCKVKRQ